MPTWRYINLLRHETDECNTITAAMFFIRLIRLPCEASEARSMGEIRGQKTAAMFPFMPFFSSW